MANYWGVGKFGVGLYSASNYVTATVAFPVAFSLTAAALAVLVAEGATAWNIPVSILVGDPSVIVNGGVAWSVTVTLVTGDVYGGLYWSEIPPLDELWTPIPVETSIWTPISAPQV